MHQSASNTVAIIIASVGRPEELGRWIDHIARQTLKPVEMIWAVTGDADLPPDLPSGDDLPVTVLRAPIGSAAQRNAGLDAMRSTPEFVAFFDDDYVPTRTCLADLVTSFRGLPDAVGLTGTLLADGINSPGIAYDAAVSLVEAFEQDSERGRETLTFEPWDGLYGCNMAFRAETMGGERFDERLPLYAWQEDVDFAARVANGRPIGRTNGFVGVHQGTKRSRTSGKRFGYSQIANPAYLYRKGTMSRRKMLTMTSRNLLANHGRMFRPEPWVDRRGRVVGNWLALVDLLLGRSQPERILEL